MRVILSADRGITQTDWLTSFHTYSFGEYYDPKRTHFGALRVVNDDRIAPGSGFGMHSHRDMEIITIVTSGVLEHRDSRGSHGVLRAFEVQVMSAGSGISHSEYNGSQTDPVELFQLWIATRQQGITPRYEQAPITLVQGREVIVASADGPGLHIMQDASVAVLLLERQKTHRIEISSGGCYLMVIEGALTLDGTSLGFRDSAELTAPATLHTLKRTTLLLIRVPL